LSEPLPAILLRSLRVAPTAPATIYVSGTRRTAPGSVVVRSGGSAVVMRSTDGGQTWSSFDHALAPTEFDLYLLGVDPRDPQRLFARTSAENDEAILVSEDGGESWNAVLHARGPFLAFAQSEDGEQVYLGSDRSGLWRSDDGGARFTAVRPDLPVHCLATRGEELWICPGYARSAFEIGRSTDRGATFEPVLHFDQFTGMTACESAEEPLEALCQSELPTIEQSLDSLEALRAQESGLAVAADAGPDAAAVEDVPATLAGSDAGPGALEDAPPDRARSAQAGGCSTVARGSRARLPLLASFALLLVSSRRLRCHVTERKPRHA
jgi:hypothetical protein